MKFLNKKEQVIDLQLTQFGKRILSKGQFKPVYYSFYDDGILYDPKYGSGSEEQNKIQTRIIKDTPQLEAQYVFDGIETNVKKANKIIRSTPDEMGEAAVEEGVLELLDQAAIFPPTLDKHYSLTSVLGTSDYNSDKFPAWEINFLRGNISGSINVQNTGSCSYPAMNITEIITNPITYQTRVDKMPPDEFNALVGEDEELLDDVYNIGNGEHGFFTVLEKDSAILLEIKEHNSFFGNENFDIEVYEIEEESVSGNPICGISEKRTILKPLYFIKKPSLIENGIIKSPIEDVTDFQDFDLDPTYVEYFMDIQVDDEIPKSIICQYVKDEGEGIFSQKVLDCDTPDQINRKRSTMGLFDAALGDIEGCGEE